MSGATPPLFSPQKQDSPFPPMLLKHPSASWRLTYEDGAANGPALLESQGAPLFHDMHCRLDAVADHGLPSTASHVRKGGCAVFRSTELFRHPAPVEVAQTQRLSANLLRLTYDISWKDANTPLKEGLEVGSLRLDGAWEKYLALSTPGEAQAAPAWKPLPRTPEEATLVLSPIPVVLLLEDQKGRRLEYGLGDDLWRWQKGLNGEFLHGTGRLVLSRDAQGLLLRRYVTFCDPQEEERLAARKQEEDPRFRASVDEEGNPIPAKAVPVSCPEKRAYRFHSYLAWSEPLLAGAPPLPSPPLELSCTPQGIQGLRELAPASPLCLSLDLAALPIPPHGRRNGEAGAPPCWESRPFQSLFRRCLRQLASLAPAGTLVLKGATPGWCSLPTHLARSGAPLPHWDLPALLECLVWARQALPEEWTIRVLPGAGVWALLPSLSALGAPSGFRNAPEEK